MPVKSSDQLRWIAPCTQMWYVAGLAIPSRSLDPSMAQPPATWSPSLSGMVSIAYRVNARIVHNEVFLATVAQQEWRGTNGGVFQLRKRITENGQKAPGFSRGMNGPLRADCMPRS